MLAVARATMAATVAPPVLVILGATGAGKSRLALELASRFGGEIISADAMQMYRGLDIVTNKVTEEEQRQVRHHMISVLHPLEHNNVVDFRNKALPVVERLLTAGKIPVICGGTNYYIESLLWKILVDQDLPFIVSGKQLNVNEPGDEEPKRPTEEIDNAEDEDVYAEEIPLNLESVDWSCDPGLPATSRLYGLLRRVDPVRAAVLHPRERRKIWRSLQVLSGLGVRHSALLAEQGGRPDEGLGGGLRFPASRICIIEVWSEQAVLDQRCDARVEKMLSQGLVAELEQFHAEYNLKRAELEQAGQLDKLDYDRGIWQSIGFKEFHGYLVLPPGERGTAAGQRLLAEGVEKMKVATRQYSRKQTRWMRRRFLTGSRTAPPVYRLDSSLPATWQEEVYLPAERLLQQFLAGSPADLQPLPLQDGAGWEREEDFRKTLHCDICDRDFKGSVQYKNHLNSKKHKLACRNVRENVEFVTKLVKYNVEKRHEVARTIKNVFAIGLTEVYFKLDNLPAELSRDKAAGKARKVCKELSKDEMVVLVEKVESTRQPEQTEVADS